MQTYLGQTPQAPIRSVAFQAHEGGYYCFVTVRDDAAARHVQELLAPSQQVLSETILNDGALIIFAGKAPPDAVIRTLSAQGQHFALPAPEKKKFNPWAWRGITSIIGQTGQVLSGLFVLNHAKKTRAPNLKDVQNDSAAIIGFAALNLVANFINILFGAQEKNDPHHLSFLKQGFNDQFCAVHGDAVTLDDPGIRRADATKKIGSFLDRNSVAFGEVFLRTLGSISLAFPVTQFGKAFKALRSEGFKAGFAAAKNQDKVTFVYGLSMLLGKLTSSFATEPDPYNPNPPSAWRSFREKVAFKLSSVIEGTGAVWATQDRFRRKKIFVGEKQIADIPGTVGNAVFVGGYAIRYTAPYGSREVDMPALYDHVVDAIARLPHEKQAAEVARTALWIAEHFAEKAMREGEKGDSYRLPMVYATLTQTLHKKHGMTLGAEHVLTRRDPWQKEPQPATSVVAGARVHGALRAPASPLVPSVA